MGRRLRRVRVEIIQGDIEDASTETAVDQLGGKFESVRERRPRVGHLRSVVLPQFLKATAAGISILRGALDKIEQPVLHACDLGQLVHRHMLLTQHRIALRIVSSGAPQVAHQGLFH